VELRERAGVEFVVVARSRTCGRAEVRIDRSWTVQILRGEMSPLVALERRIDSAGLRAVEQVRDAAAGRQLRRVDTYRSESAAPAAPVRVTALPSPRLVTVTDSSRAERPH
jgi:hypothetical protein